MEVHYGQICFYFFVRDVRGWNNGSSDNNLGLIRHFWRVVHRLINKIMGAINDQLYTLYEDNWDELIEELQDVAENQPDPQPTNPYLLYIDKEEEFKNADIRVMVFGQETNDWEGAPDKTIEHLSKVYNDFFNLGGCWKYGKPYWNGVKKFKTLLENKYPNKKIRFVANNIVKIGVQERGYGRPDSYIYDVERRYFSVIQEEIRIIKPNVIVFFTGPDRDNDILDNFGEVSYTDMLPFTQKQLAKVAIPKVAFAFRTYHPMSLQLQKLTEPYFNAIINAIKL
ncbi:hypothetical protein AGMMS4956_15280 [Bacteroidia bacterium]|nr:hypothetical protein AGMMS4956_15280 [Bacteroidia bacterium]